MFIPKSGTFVQDDPMSSAMMIAQSLERRERTRVSSLDQARRRVADRLKIGVGTFENLVRGRVKRIDATIRDRLQALLVRELEGEIARLTHELEIARQSGLRLDSEQICEVETHLARAMATLRGDAHEQNN